MPESSVCIRPLYAGTEIRFSGVTQLKLGFSAKVTSGGESAGKDASEADSRDVPADGADIPPENGDSLLSEDDPFLESDLPLTSLADDGSDAPEA